MAKRKGPGPGGARAGAGRKPGPPEKVRRNRVVVMLTDAEHEQLEGHARRAKEPLGATAYKIVAAFLRRSAAKRRK